MRILLLKSQLLLIIIFALFTSDVLASIGGKPENPLHHKFDRWFVYNLSEGESYNDSI